MWKELAPLTCSTGISKLWWDPPEKHGILTPSQYFQPIALAPRRGTFIKTDCEKQWGFCWPGKTGIHYRHRHLLKWPSMQFYSQSLILGSCRVRKEWIILLWRDSVFFGSGEGAEGIMARISVPNHCPITQITSLWV